MDMHSNDSIRFSVKPEEPQPFFDVKRNRKLFCSHWNMQIGQNLHLLVRVLSKQRALSVSIPFLKPNWDLIEQYLTLLWPIYCIFLFLIFKSSSAFSHMLEILQVWLLSRIFLNIFTLNESIRSLKNLNQFLMWNAIESFFVVGKSEVLWNIIYVTLLSEYRLTLIRCTIATWKPCLFHWLVEI